jgi:hypothetical protein
MRNSRPKVFSHYGIASFGSRVLSGLQIRRRSVLITSWGPMYKIKDDGKKWFEEFRNKPVGKHSPGLQRVLNSMRGAPQAGKFVLVCVKPHQEWAVARLTGNPGDSPEIISDLRFTDLNAAEMAIFRLRWKEHTGADLPE